MEPMLKTTVRFVLPTIVITLVLSTLPLQTAETLPNQIADDTFWQLIASLSEPGGEFQSENFLSNETGFQVVIPTPKQTTRPDGVNNRTLCGATPCPQLAHAGNLSKI